MNADYFCQRLALVEVDDKHPHSGMADGRSDAPLSDFTLKKKNATQT